jgi:tetratricopeptide (TPR) repeat protein
LDPRSDQFSFGVILIEMLTGQRAFQGPSSTAILREVVTGRPKGLEGLRGRAQQPLAALVERTLAKAPEERFPDMREVAGHLKRLAGVPGTERLTTNLAPQGGRWAQWRWPAVAGLVVVLGAAGWWATGWLARGRFERPEVASTGQAPVDTSLTYGELIDRGNELLRTRFRRGHTDQAIAHFEAALRKRPGFAPAQAGLALARYRKSRAERSAGLAVKAVEEAREAVRLDPSLARAHVALGAALSGDSKTYAEAEKELRHALELDPGSYEALTGLALVCGLTRRDAEQEQLLRKAVAVSPAGWDAKASLGGLFYRRGEYGEAAMWFERSREVARDNSDNYRNLAAAYHMLDRYDDAAAALQRALEFEPQAATYNNLGTLRFFQGRYDESRLHFRKALDLRGDLSMYWGNYGDACRWTPGQEAESGKAYARAIELAREELKSKQGDTELMSSRAMYLAKSGRRAEALEAVRGVAGLPRLAPGVMYKLAVASEAAGERAAALRYLGEAVQGGYAMREVLADPELEQLRGAPEFGRIRAARKRRE